MPDEPDEGTLPDEPDEGTLPDEPDEGTLPDEPDEPDEPVETSSACGVESFAETISYLGFTYDYDPSTSPADLAERSELVVRGELIDLTETGEIEDGGNPFFTLALEVSEVVSGSVDWGPGEVITVWVEFNRVERSFAEIEAVFAPGIDTVLFLHPFRDLGAWQPALEGFWVSCDDDSPPLIASIEPTWSSPATLADLVDAAAGP